MLGDLTAHGLGGIAGPESTAPAATGLQKVLLPDVNAIDAVFELVDTLGHFPAHPGQLVFDFAQGLVEPALFGAGEIRPVGVVLNEAGGQVGCVAINLGRGHLISFKHEIAS